MAGSETEPFRHRCIQVRQFVHPNGSHYGTNVMRVVSTSFTVSR